MICANAVFNFEVQLELLLVLVVELVLVGGGRRISLEGNQGLVITST